LFAIDQTYGRYTRFVKAARRAISRRRRLILNAIHRRVSAVKRAYYIKQVQVERIDRQIRRSRPVQTFIQLKNFVSQSV
jgi:glycerol-3-phosphate responsive antiterminator